MIQLKKQKQKQTNKQTKTFFLLVNYEEQNKTKK